MTEEEIAQLRSYLTAQALRRTPAQIVEMLQNIYTQFLTGLSHLSRSSSRVSSSDNTWSKAEILEHVCLFMISYQTAICLVLESGERPPDVCNRTAILPHANSRSLEDFFSTLQKCFDRLKTVVLAADPNTHLDITWNHFELGAMNWREWLLFARVHLLDHVRQVQALSTTEITS